MDFALTDLSYDLAYNAHRGTSFVPEDRAKQEQALYVAHMENLYKELSSLATTEAQKAILEAEMERYKAKYLQMYSAVLNAAGRTLSAMITGPSNFPVRRNQKNLDIEHKRRQEFFEWEAKAQKAMKSKICPGLSGVISSDDPSAIQKLETKLELLEHMQSLMKKANVIVRKKKLSTEEKFSAMVETGLSEAQARQALEADYMGRLGFPRYMLSNNNATIKNTKERIEMLKAKANDTTTEIEIGEIKILDNVEDNRVQILFPDKPNEHIRKKLKSHGFIWAPSKQAWQRMRSSEAMRYAKQIVSGL